jgi:hypothetical protein
MSLLTWVLIAAGLIVVLVVGFGLVRRQRSTQLHRQFGPEYERTVAEEGRRSGESRLRERVDRRQRFETRELSPDARGRYVESWRLIQERFVDHPVQSIRDADQLVQQVMRERGYPTQDFERRAEDISVDHPDVVEHYRAAHDAAEASSRGDATTEDLRKAMIHYRNLVGTLLGTNAGREDAPGQRDVDALPEQHPQREDQRG